jgi:hypothetical protein
MKRIIKLAILTVAGVAVSMQIASAQSNANQAADSRVKATLDKLGYKYEVLPTGAFKLVVEMGDGRSQLVFIDSQTESLGKFEIRQILSPGYQSNGPLSAAVANKLLEYSANQKLGAWQIFKSDDSNLAVFTAKIAASSDPESLENSMMAVVQSADEVEKELSGKDDF